VYFGQTPSRHGTLKNTLLQTAFSAILPTEVQYCSQPVHDVKTTLFGRCYDVVWT